MTQGLALQLSTSEPSIQMFLFILNISCPKFHSASFSDLGRGGTIMMNLLRLSGEKNHIFFAYFLLHSETSMHTTFTPTGLGCALSFNQILSFPVLLP